MHAPDGTGDRLTDTPPSQEAPAPGRRAVVDAGIAAIVAGTGFVLFQPEWFDNQNGLDPFFYSGLSLNLSDSIDYGTSSHYFLSRWTLYVPELVTERVLGPAAGFITLRLLLLVLAGLGLALLRPAASRRLDLVPVALVALFSPLFARAVFVDYSDAVVVPVGLVMVALAAKARVGPVASAALGVLAACAVVANAFAVFMVAITVGGYLARSLPRPRRLVVQLPVLAAGGAVVVLGGLAFYRWRYGIDNVYAPTVDFVRDNVGYRDLLKSPRLLWLQYRLWIYLPPLVLATAAALRATRLIRFGTGDLTVLGMCAAQYAFQVAYQFLRDGSTLEISYYFSYGVPAYTAALAVVLYGLLQRCSARAATGATTAVVLAFATWRFLPELRLGSWVVFVAGMLALAAAGALLARRVPLVAPLAVVTVVLAAQLAPPEREPVLPGELRVQPGYPSLYRREGEFGEQRFLSAARFVRRMHTLDLGVRKHAGWVVGDGLGPQLAATYSIQVAQPSRWLNPPPGPGVPYQAVRLLPALPARLDELGLTHLVLVCAPEEVAPIVERLRQMGLALGPPVLDYLDPTSPVTRVLVAPVTAAAGTVPPSP